MMTCLDDDMPKGMVESGSLIGVNVAQWFLMRHLEHGEDTFQYINGTVDVNIPVYYYADNAAPPEGIFESDVLLNNYGMLSQRDVHAGSSRNSTGHNVHITNLVEGLEAWAASGDQDCRSCQWTTTRQCQEFPPDYHWIGWINNPSGNTRTFTVWSNDNCTGNGLTYRSTQQNFCFNINPDFDVRSYQMNG